MRTILAVSALMLVPAALAAQAPVGLARDTVPTHVPLPAPPAVPPVLAEPETDHPAQDALVGAGEGAVTGAVLGAVVAVERPDCALAESPAASAVAGAGIGAVWGGLRGLLGMRGRKAPAVLASGPVRPEPARVGPRPPVVDGRCLAGVPGQTEPRQ